jgi:hypothetical protein
MVIGKTYGENEMVILFYSLFTIVKVGFSFLFHYFAHLTLITNTKVSELNCRHITRRLWTQKTFEVWCVYLVFYGFDLKTSSAFYPF